MDHLDRLFQRLVHNIRSRNPAHLTLPFTVAELYEQIVPYRHNRRELGIETNQDYEIAITRLLSGERGYLLGDEAMQESLRRELSSRSPDMSAFREFGTAEVSIAPATLDSIAAHARPEAPATPATQTTGAAREPSPPAPAGPPPQSAAASPPTKAPAATEPAATPDGAAVEDVTLREGCRFCGATLPEGRQVKFCPNCGQNLSVSRCPACGSEIESGWKFCVTCGRPVGP